MRLFSHPGRVLALALVLAGSAAAAPGDPDPVFGASGVANPRIGRSIDQLRSLFRQADGKWLAVGTTTSGVRGDIGLARFDASGAPDTTFGNAGRVRVEGQKFGGVRGARLQPDGKIVVAHGNGSVDIQRFMPDGSIDTAFGNSGKAVSPGCSGGDLDLQPDGGIVVVLYTGNCSPGTRSGVARLTPTGVLDTAFGNSGEALMSGSDVTPRNALVQPDGRIVVVGFASTNGYKAIAARFLANGKVDPTFGTAGQGQVAHLIASQVSEVTTAALQSDGRILIAGRIHDYPTGSSLFMLRLNSDGSLDLSFGSGGIVKFGALVGEGNEYFFTPGEIRQEQSGRIVMAVGSQGLAPTQGFRVVAITASGAVDATFPGGGRLLLPPQAGRHESSQALVPLASGGYAIGGHVDYDFAIKRIDASGALDTAFGSGGTARAEFAGGRAGYMVGVRELPGGKMVAVAQFTGDENSPLEGVGLARFNADGSHDPTFGIGGMADTTFCPFFGVDWSVRAFAVQPDGKVVVAGSGCLATREERGAIVARFNADGTPDAAFGRRLIAFKAEDTSAAHAVGVLSDGTIVVAGYAAEAAPASAGLFVARLSSTGAPDTAFAPNGVKRFDIASGPSLVMDLVVGADDRVTIAGNGGGSLAVIRLLPNGAGDASFGFSGAIAMGSDVRPHRVLAGADGKTTIAGSRLIVFSNRPFTAYETLAVGRLAANGQPDASFGNSGWFSPAEPAFYGASQCGAVVRGAALTVSGRIVVSGTTTSPYLAWITPAGTLDPFLKPVNMAVADSTCSRDLRLLPDGKLLVGLDTPLGLVSSASPFYLTRRMQAPDGPVGDVDGDGIPDGVEAPESRDPYAKDNDIFGSARLFAMQQYRDFLGREGDASGLFHWTNQLATGQQSRAQMAETFYNSQEFQGTGAPVARLYFAYFLRIPDYDGLQFWISRFRSGTLLEGISDAFASSPEFAATYGSLDNGQFVNLVYQNILGRPADSAGLAFWKGRLDSAQMTRGQVMLAFSESPEYRALIANEIYVTMMYAGMLRRSPEAEGFAFWVGYLDASNSGLALTNGFLAASEYRSRFMP